MHVVVDVVKSASMQKEKWSERERERARAHIHIPTNSNQVQISAGEYLYSRSSSFFWDTICYWDQLLYVRVRVFSSSSNYKIIIMCVFFIVVDLLATVRQPMNVISLYWGKTKHMKMCTTNKTQQMY